MKQFLAFIIKEYKHIIRDKRTLLILFGMPIAQVVLFGFALNNDVKDASLVVFDQSGDYHSMRLINKINTSEYFDLVKTVQNDAELEGYFKSGAADIAIIFPSQFGQKLLRGEQPEIMIVGDATEPNQALTLTNYAKAIINDYIRDKAPKVRSAIVLSETRMMYNPELEAVFMFVPGVVAAILMLVSAMMTSITIAREKELGTMSLLLISPLKPYQIIVGKVVPYWALSLINALIVVLIGIFAFGMPMRGSVVLLALCCILFIFTALALGILISTKANSQLIAMMMSAVGLMMPTILLSGFIFPIENMPLLLQWLSHILPARWFIDILKGIMIQGSGIEYLWKPIAILFGIMLIILVAGIRNLKIRLE